MMRSAMTAASQSTPGRGTRRFEDVLVTRTIRAIEESGPLEDAAELRDAARSASTDEGRAIARARALGQRIGLLQDLARLRALALRLVPLVALGIVLLTWLLVGSVLGDGRRINVLLAWLGVLGPNFVSLLVWAAAVLAPRSSGLAPLAEGLGGLALRASSRPRCAGSHAPALLQQGTGLVREARLLPWAFGVLNHGVWALSLLGLIGVLSLMFALRSYQLSWESTILPPSAFADFIAATGRPAELLGLPRADVRGVTPGDAASHPKLAFWLIYGVLLYGLVPRLLLALWCWRMWARSRDAVPLDLGDPYYRRLFQRLDRLAAPVIVDADDAPAGAASAPVPGRAGAAGGPPVWIGFELPPELAWRADDDGLVQIDVAGDSEGRHRAIDRLVREPAARAVVVCHGASSPDRGTARFLRDVAARVGAMALLLVVPAAGAPARTAVWTAWLQDGGFGALPVFEQPAAARAWLASSAEAA